MSTIKNVASGFNDNIFDGPRKTISFGWKMKNIDVDVDLLIILIVISYEQLPYNNRQAIIVKREKNDKNYINKVIKHCNYQDNQFV